MPIIILPWLTAPRGTHAGIHGSMPSYYESGFPSEVARVIARVSLKTACRAPLAVLKFVHDTIGLLGTGRGEELRTEVVHG